MKAFIQQALNIGFSRAAVMATEDLVIKPEYRKYCEANLCGNYDRLPCCPTQCGSVEEMAATLRRYDWALVLQSEYPSENMNTEDMQRAQAVHNYFTENLMAEMQKTKPDILFIASGPWKDYSSLSAYCIDSEQMAESVGMKCWEKDNILRCFSLLLYRSND